MDTLYFMEIRFKDEKLKCKTRFLSNTKMEYVIGTFKRYYAGAFELVRFGKMVATSLDSEEEIKYLKMLGEEGR